MEKTKKFTRYNSLIIIMVIIFSVILAKLYYLQVYKGQYYKDKATIASNTHKITIEAPRGLILDKNGITLAKEVPGYNLSYTDTSKSNKQLFTTLQKVFKILDENGEVQTDSFALKINPYRFEFNSSDPKSIQILLLRFIKDRGLQGDILKTKFKNKKETDLTPSEVTEFNNALLKFTPKQIYNQLLKNYGVIEGISSLHIDAYPALIRRYLVVNDDIKMNYFTQYKPISIATNLKKDTSFIIDQILSELPGIKVDYHPMRQYPYGQLASSVLGYISKISPTASAKYTAKGYDTSVDYVGTSGIEAAMESSLKGVNGQEEIIVDNQASVKKGSSLKKATPGNNVQITIDANLQYATASTLNSEMTRLQRQGGSKGDLDVSNATRGAAVVEDIHTGDILALVSLPGYDPNDFSTSQGLTQAKSEKYFNPDYEKLAKANGIPQSLINFMFPIDKNIKGNTTIRNDKYDYFPKYLYNYATMSLIPSGSTLKPMTAIVGLQTGVIDGNSTYDDKGGYDMGGENKIGGPNWNRFESDGSNGVVNVVRAIEKSSNPFFMNVGQKLREKFGDDILAKYAWMFGLGANPKAVNPGTGIEISENFGQIYNTVSQKNLSATQYLYNIEESLTLGVSVGGVKSPSIDLYDRENDKLIESSGKKLSEIKTEIKNAIKSSVKNGTYSKSNYQKLFKELISADPKYKKIKFTDANIKAILDKIYFLAVDEGHRSLSRPYNMFIASIGQGMDNFTPLQMVNYIATLANGGTRYKLNLVDNVTDYSGKLVSQTKPVVLNKADLSATTRNLVMQGMNNVTGPGGNTDGTASEALRDFPIPTGGKTGTAQFNNPELQNKIGRSDYAWYVGYAPAQNPEIAISVVIFDGGYGSDAANVARGIYESYFKNDPRMAKYKNKYDIELKSMDDYSEY
ncbi:penicillin-binding transpeptidase domain-containing protein [Clostridium sp.]|uniref:penicillin-binding transpeptidase domain-containing protein n=1 Tax=Clostridium sp. TaxID=1506 RepID=UPI003D6C9CE6